MLFRLLLALAILLVALLIVLPISLKNGWITPESGYGTQKAVPSKGSGP